MLRQCSDREVLDDLLRVRVDDVDRVARAVGDVDARKRTEGGAGEHVHAVLGVDVGWACRDVEDGVVERDRRRRRTSSSAVQEKTEPCSDEGDHNRA
jgi:hypothetical protein